MSEYWKSTPSYWCKFCAIYVRDTGLERKNHESSAKHQNSIQRSLRTLHKDREREERDKQRAKDEVARLNGLVDGGKKGSASGPPKTTGARDVAYAPSSVKIDPATERIQRAHQLLALGVVLPDSLKKEVTGVGDWQTVSERVVADEGPAEARSLADILKQEREAEDRKPTVSLDSGERKRKMEDDEYDARDEEAPPKIRRAWGSTIKRYPGDNGADYEEEMDLGALLSGVKGKKKASEIKKEEDEGVKKEEPADEGALAAIPDIDAAVGDVKSESKDEEAVAPVVFKKRKGKR